DRVHGLGDRRLASRTIKQSAHRSRRSIVQGAVRADSIVVFAPGIENDLRFGASRVCGEALCALSAPRACTAEREASQLFSDTVLQDVAIEREIGDDLFQFPTLVAQRPQLTQLLHTKARELLLPPIECLLADADSPTHLGDLLAGFDLPERVDDLVVGSAMT